MDSLDARIFWSDAAELGQLTVDAEPIAAGDRDGVDFRELTLRSLLLVGVSGEEFWTVAERGAALSLRVRSGTLRAGPVRLHYALAGLRRLEAQLGSLRRLLTLTRTGHLQTARKSRGPALKYYHMLCTLDCLDTHQGARQIACRLFGRERAERDWRRDSDYLRLRIQRLKRSARDMLNGGYMRLLS